jgi:hypothetical protein
VRSIQLALPSVLERLRRVRATHWIAVLLLLGALVVSTSQWRRDHHQRELESWPRAEATVLATTTEMSLDGIPRYGGRIVVRTEVAVAFVVAGVPHEARARVEGLGATESVEARLPPGERIWISYDPADPTEARFAIGSVGYEPVDLMPTALGLALAGSGLLVLDRRRARRTRS